LIRLINDILDLERIRSGKITMNRRSCNLADLMTQATEEMQAMADRSEIQLITELMSISLDADPDRIVQTLTNLLSNAIKFSPAQTTVQMQACSSGHTSSVCISVCDQGRGIPSHTNSSRYCYRWYKEAIGFKQQTWQAFTSSRSRKRKQT